MDYLDIQAAVGISKHFGGLRASKALYELCHVRDAARVLEVGCGIGVGPSYLAKTYNCPVVAVDISPQMIAWAEQRAREQGVTDRIAFYVADVMDLPFEAVVEGKEDEVKREIEQTLEKDRAQANLDELEHKVEISQVKAMLERLKDKREVAEMRRMMPAYVRRFFQLAAPTVGVGIRGDVEGTFALDPCPASVTYALGSYPEEIRDKLTFDRERAMPDLAQDPQAIYLHPGEPVTQSTPRFDSSPLLLFLHLGLYAVSATDLLRRPKSLWVCPPYRCVL